MPNLQRSRPPFNTVVGFIVTFTEVQLPLTSLFFGTGFAFPSAFRSDYVEALGEEVSPQCFYCFCPLSGFRHD